MGTPAEDEDPLTRANTLVNFLSGFETGSDPDPGEDGAHEDDGQIQLAFTDLDAWVAGWLSHTLELKAAKGAEGGAPWCPLWTEHPEVVVRLTAVWRDWETARASEAMGRWWLDWDGHLAAITGEYGPFAKCRHQHAVSHPPMQATADGPDSDG